MSGAVYSGGQKLRGWARLAEQPDYPVTVHLVAGNDVLKSMIAEEKCSDASVPDALEASRAPCWFEFDVDDVEGGRTGALRIVVGETGERLLGVTEQSDNSDDAGEIGPVLTYRDALASGMSVMDVVGVLYLDILRRPIDRAGLAHYRAEMARGARSFEHVRRQLLASNEYVARRKLLRDAAGNALRRDMVWRSADAVLAFEPLFTSFCADDLPYPARLIRFFPGLLVDADAMKETQRDVARALPAREIFQRALTRLARRPALLIDPDAVLEARRADDTDGDAAPAGETDAVVDVPCGSPHFVSGWHNVEGTRREPHRWMKQIGTIRNPHPRRPLEAVEVEITSTYADAGDLFAAGDSEQLEVAMQARGEHGRLARITSGGGLFVSPRLVLISERATSPFRHDGAPDPRCLSIQVSQARFVYAADRAS